MKILANDLLEIELLEQGAVEGHVKIDFNDSLSSLDDLSLEHQLLAWNASNLTASTLFEGLQAQGTNLIIREGPSLSIDVLPRSQGDGLDLFWNPERADPGALEQVASKIKDRLWFVNRDVPDDESSSNAGQQEETTTSEINMKVQHILNRSP